MASSITTYAKVAENTNELSDDIISIVDPYIKENSFEYKLENENELVQKIGKKGSFFKEIFKRGF